MKAIRHSLVLISRHRIPLAGGEPLLLSRRIRDEHFFYLFFYGQNFYEYSNGQKKKRQERTKKQKKGQNKNIYILPMTRVGYRRTC